MKNNKLARLQRLQAAADRLRKELGFRAQGEIIYRRALSVSDEDEVFVVSSGLGSATVLVIDGNFPIDFTVRHEQVFDSEKAATQAADAIEEDDEILAGG